MLQPLMSALILVLNLQSSASLVYKQDAVKNIRYQPVANIFIYFFFNNRYQNWLLKTRGRVVK